jgi:hypothetical protein
MAKITRRIVLSGAAVAASMAALDRFQAKMAFAATPSVCGVSAMIESSFRANPGSPGNFEALLLAGTTLMHYWRDNSTGGFPWHLSTTVSTTASTAACLIQSSFRGTPSSPGNFEALVLEGNNLVHYWRDNSAGGFPWHRGPTVSTQATGAACLIQSSFRGTPSSPGNFEALVLEGTNLVHYWRDNSAGGFPWHRGPTVSTTARGPASLIESSFRGTPSSPGNFEVLVPESSSLAHYWRDNSAPGFPWHRSTSVTTGLPGSASLIQSSFRGTPSSPGNFETLVLQSNKLVHYWRDNSAPGFPWHSGATVRTPATGAACLIQSSFRGTPTSPGNFEALVPVPGRLAHYWRDNSAIGFPWHQGVTI